MKKLEKIKKTKRLYISSGHGCSQLGAEERHGSFVESSDF